VYVLHSVFLTSEPSWIKASETIRRLALSWPKRKSGLKGGDETLAAFGDQTAFFIYTVMVSSPPLSAAQTLTALDIIHKSFARPSAIQGGDRKPVASLALLKIFQATAVDQMVKERVAAETNYLNTLPATIDSAPIGVPGQPPPAGPVGLF
jgi:hypothetical protein